ncbi:hypothetical protein QJS10_CPB11g02049 [Acorus calamus]|uniref:RNA-binding S4 domain-containing protein n=1 Tax=Acorus calamus TaxID=4465 RepID=A0AAV9DRA0_ACOCL|nr:hypothetical protein QJS10_CPB11g02049 [Acorus calamus]
MPIGLLMIEAVSKLSKQLDRFSQQIQKIGHPDCTVAMLSLLPATYASPTQPLRLLRRNPKNYRVSDILLRRSSSSASGESDDHLPEQEQPRRAFRGNHAGERLEERVAGAGVAARKSRLDAWISSRIPGVSRARVQSSIRSGLVSVNGRTVDKVSQTVKEGDFVECTVSEVRPLSAEPEDIPLDIVYEDDHVLVLNKPAHMVVHPAPGNPNGTLVNGILNHCRLPAVAASLELDDGSDDEFDCNAIAVEGAAAAGGCVRPGIVHRLDKGTSGLLVVAKDEDSHAHLSEQFKLHTIHRVYISLTIGVPSPSSGRIDIPIARDSIIEFVWLQSLVQMPVGGLVKLLNALSFYWSMCIANYHRYKVIEILAGGGSALVEWRLETGRTHQIRVHAKHLGIPLLGDEIYGGTKSMALSMLRPRTRSSCHGLLSSLVSKIERPCLHALYLGFKHPHTGEDVKFSCPPPADFAEVLTQLRTFGSEKIIQSKSSRLSKISD